MRVIRMFTLNSRAAALRKRAISKPSIPKAFTTQKPEMLSCRISEMSRQRRSEVSFEARSRCPKRISKWKAGGIPTRANRARRQSM